MTIEIESHFNPNLMNRLNWREQSRFVVNKGFRNLFFYHFLDSRLTVIPFFFVFFWGLFLKLMVCFREFGIEC